MMSCSTRDTPPLDLCIMTLHTVRFLYGSPKMTRVDGLLPLPNYLARKCIAAASKVCLRTLLELQSV